MSNSEQDSLAGPKARSATLRILGSLRSFSFRARVRPSTPGTGYSVATHASGEVPWWLYLLVQGFANCIFLTLYACLFTEIGFAVHVISLTEQGWVSELRQPCIYFVAAGLVLAFFFDAHMWKEKGGGFGVSQHP